MRGNKMFDETIKTIQQAKEFFIAMGCSGFHMSREYPKRYDEYKQLHISTQAETEWRKEEFDRYYASIMDNTNPGSLWMYHSSMESLLYALKSELALMRMLEVTQFMRDKVPLNDRVIVAETINGRTVRKARMGLIYLAYDWNNIPAAKAFVELSLHFSAYYNEQDNRGIERCRNAIKRCNDIKRELKL
jgi:hypothetical protein